MKYLFKFINLINIAIILQFVYFFVLVFGLKSLSIEIFHIMTALGIICLVFIITEKNSDSYRSAWIFPILILPSVFGLAYIFYNRGRVRKKINSDFLKARKRAEKFVYKNDDIKKCGKEIIADYIKNTTGFPQTDCGDAVYFKNGESLFEPLLTELKKAEKYILIEMFIIKPGIMWDRILYTLIEKVKQGVDVRIIYDSKGSMYTLPYSYYKELRKIGIKCVVFNPLRFLATPRYNITNHRKIISIDGKTVFIGGFNLSDEYINKKPDAKTGHWKDSGVKITSGTAWNFTLMFLTMWEFISRTRINYERFVPEFTNNENKFRASTWFDTPLDYSPVSEQLYVSMILRSSNYLYITTPYLTPSDEILSALCTAAGCGVDVRLILPFIPDKILVQMVSKSFYSPLLEAGVKIYEYAPGFIHAKNFVSDDNLACVSSLNLDYRSLYLHHECGVCFFNGTIINDVKSDFLSTLVSCKEVEFNKYREAKILQRVLNRVCRILAPLI